MALLPPEPVYVLKANMGYVHSIAYADYEKTFSSTLAASTESGFVYLWDMESHRVKYKQKMGASIIAIHSIDENLITHEKSGNLNTWAVKKSVYQIEKSYKCNSGYCRSLVFNEKIIVPEENSNLGVLDLNLNRIGTLMPGGEVGRPMCLERLTIKEEDYILAGYESGDVILYNLNMFKECSKLHLNSSITSISYDPVWRRVVCGNSTNVLQLFTIDQALNMALKCEINITTEGCAVVKVRPDRKIFASGCNDGKIRIFSGKSLRVLAALTEHKKVVTDIQFSPCVVNFWKSNIMAASSSDGSISLWNIYN